MERKPARGTTARRPPGKPRRLDVAPPLPANAVVLRSLELPGVYVITMAEELGIGPFLARARARSSEVSIDPAVREKSFAGH